MPDRRFCYIASHCGDAPLNTRIKNFFRNSPIWLYVSAIAVALAFTVLIPRLTPTVSDPKDPDRPFSASVTITNSGLLPLNHVSALIAVREIRGNGSVPFVDFVGRSDYSSQVGNTQWFPHALWPDDRFTVALNDVYSTTRERLGKADMGIVVHYELPIIHVGLQKIFPLHIVKQSNGNFYWFADAPHG